METTITGYIGYRIFEAGSFYSEQGMVPCKLATGIAALKFARRE